MNRKGTKTFLLLPFLSSSCLNNSAVQAVDSWPLRAAQVPLLLAPDIPLYAAPQLSLECCSCACKGGRSHCDPPVPVSQLLPPLPVPCYPGDG